MKTKILILLVSLVLLIGVTVGCTNDEENLSDNTMMAKQDSVDVVGTVQIQDELGIKIVLPATIENEACSIINGEIGVISFDYDGLAYKYYVKAADSEEDATGIASTLPNPETVLVDNATYKLAYQTDGAGVAYWYDKNNKVACTLLISENATPDALKAMTESIMSVQ
jgi:hypothetical protein